MQNNELLEMEYQDMLVDLAMCFTQKGVRRVLMDFQMYYPELFQELQVQAQRIPPKPLPALLRK